MALDAVAQLPAPQAAAAGTRSAQGGRPAPGSAGERAEEAALERLDP
jgi:hypothetical protein